MDDAPIRLRHAALREAVVDDVLRRCARGEAERWRGGEVERRRGGVEARWRGRG